MADYMVGKSREKLIKPHFELIYLNKYGVLCFGIQIALNHNSKGGKYEDANLLFSYLNGSFIV